MSATHLDALEAWLYALMRAVYDSSETAEEATFFLADEIRASHHRGRQAARAPENARARPTPRSHMR